MPPLSAPKWNPKDKASPLKEEYLVFHTEVTRYHDRVEGVLDAYPVLAARLTDIPESLKSFTDRIYIILSVSDLREYVVGVRALYDEAIRERTERSTSAYYMVTDSGTSRSSTGLKVALPTPFDGSATHACIFLAECNDYYALNEAKFPSDRIRIQWTLQLCTDRAATWKRIQLDLATSTDLPDHLIHWPTFEKEFRLKWFDLNAKPKARSRFLEGIRQTGSVRRYTEIFEEVLLEAEFNDPEVITEASFNGLKYEVKRDLVGRRPTEYAELKALAITLDEERMAATESERREQKLKSTTRAPELTPAPVTNTNTTPAPTADPGSQDRGCASWNSGL
jgi:Retrotransposon gag protein